MNLLYAAAEDLLAFIRRELPPLLELKEAMDNLGRFERIVADSRKPLHHLRPDPDNGSR